MQLLVSLSDIILFSAAIPHQGGTHHVNEQPPGYWADIFAKHDYVCFDIRPALWNNKKIMWWYRQNTFLYIHKSKAHIFEQMGLNATKNPVYIAVEECYTNMTAYYTKAEQLQKKLNKTFFRRLNRLSKKLRGKL